MDCDSAREAISARIDGEDPGVGEADLDAHLAGCAGCRAWEQRAHAVTRRARIGGAFLDRDLAPLILAAVPARVAWWRRVPWRRVTVPRAALVLLALGQLAIAVPMLLGHDHDAGVHASHELGSFNLALAIAFAVGAVRPRLSGGLAWPCGIAATGLVVTALADLYSGQAIGADEAAHLIAVAGSALLAWQSVRAARRTAGSAAGTVGEPAGAGDTFTMADVAPGPPGGTAAGLTGPETAAQATTDTEGRRESVA